MKLPKQGTFSFDHFEKFGFNVFLSCKPEKKEEQHHPKHGKCLEALLSCSLHISGTQVA
jgi:hypothetical protein